MKGWKMLSQKTNFCKALEFFPYSVTIQLFFTWDSYYISMSFCPIFEMFSSNVLMLITHNLWLFMLWLPLSIKLWYISLSSLPSISWCLITHNSCITCFDFLWTSSYWKFPVCLVPSLKYLEASASTRKAFVIEIPVTDSIAQW